METEGEKEVIEDELTYRDVLLTLAMDQLETGAPVDVIATLLALGMGDVVKAAEIAQEIESDEGEDDLPVDDPEPDDVEGG